MGVRGRPRKRKFAIDTAARVSLAKRWRVVVKKRNENFLQWNIEDSSDEEKTSGDDSSDDNSKESNSTTDAATPSQSQSQSANKTDSAASKKKEESKPSTSASAESSAAAPPVKRGRGRPPKHPRPGMPGYVEPPPKPQTPRLKLDGKPKAKPGRKPGSTLASTEKKAKAKKLLLAKKSSENTSKKEKEAAPGAGKSTNVNSASAPSSGASVTKPVSHVSKNNSQPPQLSPQPAPQLNNTNTNSKPTMDSGIYDFQSDDADSQKTFPITERKTVMKVIEKKYWMPPPHFIDRQITITEVNLGGIAVTFRESKDADFLAKKEQDRELKPLVPTA